MKTARDVFVQRLKQLLPTEKRTGRQKEVSARSGISETTLSNWRNDEGQVNPELSTIEKLASALGVSPAYLIWDGTPLPGATPEDDGFDEAAAERDVQAAEAMGQKWMDAAHDMRVRLADRRGKGGA
jgi:transcriptional regulator with XRE-family HTH domain